MRAPRHAVLSLAALASAGAIVAVAPPAEAACSVQLVAKPAGSASTCYSWATGYLVTVENGSVTYYVTCWGSLYDSGTVTAALPRLGTTPSGGCQGALTIVAQASGTIAWGTIG